MSAYAAQKQFEDNLANYVQTPEQQNLYNGLGNLATELQRISAALARLELEVARIKQ